MTRSKTYVDRGPAAQRRENAAPPGSGKEKKDVSPKRTGLTVRLPFGGPIRPEGQSEAIAAGRGPSEAPGKTKNREIGKKRKGRKAQLDAPRTLRSNPDDPPENQPSKHPQPCANHQAHAKDRHPQPTHPPASPLQASQQNPPPNTKPPNLS